MDANTNIISQLKATELFEHCDDGALDTVSASCETIHLKKGEVLFHQGDESDTLFIVVDGFLRITVDQPQMGELQIAKVGAGKLIGEMHTMKVDCRTATVVAEQDAELLSISHALFLEILESSLPLSDYTIPLTSIVGGRRLDECLKKGFQDIKIEDLWLNYFSLSSDLITAQVAVQRQGYLWEAVRASISIPGILPPVINGKSLLIDGGILNNLPGDVMKEVFGGFVIAVDVSRDTSLSVDYNKIPSAARLLWSKIWPFTHSLEVPRTVDILIGSTLLNSINQRNDVKSNIADLYLQPPVSEFKMLDFIPIEQISETGYHYTKQQIEGRIARELRHWVQT